MPLQIYLDCDPSWQLVQQSVVPLALLESVVEEELSKLVVALQSLPVVAQGG